MFPDPWQKFPANPFLKLMQANMGIALAANEVILRRTLQMMTGTMSGTEAARMLTEKPVAMMASAGAAAGATLRGRPLTGVAEAALAPYVRKTRSNAKRLRG